MTKLLQLGAGGVLVATALVVSAVDKQVNYVEVEGQVLSVNDACFLEKKEGKTTHFTDPMECESATALLELHPAYRGFSLVHDRTVQLWYPDPAKQDYNTATIDLGRSLEHPDLKTGDSMTIFAHKTKPGKVRKN